MRFPFRTTAVQAVGQGFSATRGRVCCARSVALSLERLEDRLTPSGNYLLVNDLGRDQVLRYDAATGAFVDTFVPKHSGGMNSPWGVLFGPDGNLYVSTGMWGGPGQLKAVLRYNGTTGAFIDEFAQGGNLTRPLGMIFGPDGNLYVGDNIAGVGGRVARYAGTTGTYLGDFVSPRSGGLRFPGGMTFGPSGRDHSLDLYVSSTGSNSVLRYDGTTGAFLGEFVAGGTGGLANPEGLTFGPDGNLYVASLAFDSAGARAVLRFQGPSGSTPGAFIEEILIRGAGGLQTPLGVLFGPDGNGDGNFDLYVSNIEGPGGSPWGKNATVKRYDGITGAFIDTFVTAGSGGLDDSQLMTFTATDPVTLAYTEAGSSRSSAPAAAPTLSHTNQLAILQIASGQTAKIGTPVASLPHTPSTDASATQQTPMPSPSPRLARTGASGPTVVRLAMETQTVLDSLFAEFPDGLGLPSTLRSDTQ